MLRRIAKIKGLIPALDRRKIGEPFVVDGQNFWMHLDGPFSGFGAEEFYNVTVESAQYVQSFRIENTSFIFTRTGILQYDETQRQLIPIHIFTTPLTVLAPWSGAQCGLKWFFGREGAALLEYDPTENRWTELLSTEENFYPEVVYGVAASHGRLVILSDTFIQWSSIDDGNDLEPSIDTGAGAQSLAILGKGQPLGIFAVADGVLTFTKNGILKSTVVQSLNPFYHKVLTRRHVAINAHCVTLLGEEEVVFLTSTGLYATTGAMPEVWQGLLSEHFHHNILPGLDLTIPAVIKLTYAYERRWLLISIALAEQAGIYNKAFVYYEHSDEWGSFDRTHVGFIDVWLQETLQRVGFVFSYVTSDGKIFRITQTPYITEQRAPGLYDYIVEALAEYPVRVEQGVYKFPSVIQLASMDDSRFTIPGMYQLWNDDTKFIDC